MTSVFHVYAITQSNERAKKIKQILDNSRTTPYPLPSYFITPAEEFRNLFTRESRPVRAKCYLVDNEIDPNDSGKPFRVISEKTYEGGYEGVLLGLDSPSSELPDVEVEQPDTVGTIQHIINEYEHNGMLPAEHFYGRGVAVFYIGKKPTTDHKGFCEKNKINMIKLEDIARLFGK